MSSDFGSRIAVVSETNHPGSMTYKIVGSQESLLVLLQEAQAALKSLRAQGSMPPNVSFEIHDFRKGRPLTFLALVVDPDLAKYAPSGWRGIYRDRALLGFLLAVFALAIVGFFTTAHWVSATLLGAP